MQLDEIGEQAVGVVQRVGPLRMSRHLRDLPRRQLGVDRLVEVSELFGELFDFVGDVELVNAVVQLGQFIDFGLQLGQRLLEIEVGLFCHGRDCSGQSAA